jgi:hypothetical protein
MKKPKKEGRPSQAEADATRYAVVKMLRHYPLLSYADAAIAAQISQQRLGQIAREEPGLEQYREEQKAKQIAKIGKGYPVIKLPKE